MYGENPVIVAFDVRLFDFGWGVREDAGCVLKIRIVFVRSFFICWWNWLNGFVGLNYVIFPIATILVAYFLSIFGEII